TDGRIEAALGDRGVVGFERPAAGRAVEVELVHERIERVRRDRVPRLVPAFQEMLHLGVEDLPADAAGLVEDDTAQLRVRVELEVLTLVEEAKTARVDEDAVGIR